MKYVSASRMKEIDRLAIERFGIPALILMENAGRSAAIEAEKMLKNNSALILIFCGYGNNGGDGFVIARHLINSGYNVKVLMVGKIKQMGFETKTNFSILKKMKTGIRQVRNLKQIKQLEVYFTKAQLIIDCIFGVGIKGSLGKFYCQLIAAINYSKIPILAVDIPSGLDADKGLPLPIAIKADKTITMGLAKKCFQDLSTRKHYGEVKIGDISLPRQLKYD